MIPCVRSVPLIAGKGHRGPAMQIVRVSAGLALPRLRGREEDRGLFEKLSPVRRWEATNRPSENRFRVPTVTNKSSHKVFHTQFNPAGASRGGKLPSVVKREHRHKK